MSAMILGKASLALVSLALRLTLPRLKSWTGRTKDLLRV